MQLGKVVTRIDDEFRILNREIAALVVLTAVAGSLAASEIFGWQTFTLSSLQRALMYPLLPILGAVIALEVRDSRKYVLPFSTLGMIVSAYHHILVRFDPTRGCGFALPCSSAYRYTVGGLTLRPMYLPLLAFTAFGIVTFLTWRYEPLDTDKK